MSDEIEALCGMLAEYWQSCNTESTIENRVAVIRETLENEAEPRNVSAFTFEKKRKGYMELQIFENSEFGEIRTTVDDSGRILFCGSDVAKVLGYQEPHKAIRRYTKGGMKHPTPTDRGIRELTFIPEPDVYRLIFRSKLPTAEKFEQWNEYTLPR